MRNDRYENKSRARGLADQELVIPEMTQQKIEAAYDIVRARYRERQAEEMKESRKDSRRAVRRRTLRPSMAAALAAAMVLLCGLGVAAAVGHFTKNVQESGGDVSYTFEVNYEMQPVEVTAAPEYLPEDMVVADGDKYGSGKEDGRDISIWPMNMADIDYYKETMDFTGVEKVEKTTIQGMEAHLITFRDAEKYLSPKDIYLFNPDEGYVLWIWGDYAVSMEELVKVAENLTITMTENPDLAYMSEEEKALEAENEREAQEELEAAVNRGVAPEDITPVGEALDTGEVMMGASYTVERAGFYDSLYEVPGYTADGVCDLEELAPWLNEDGTHKPYLRSLLDENGEITGEETTEVKFLAVEAVVRQERGYSEGWDSTPFDAVLVLLQENGEGRLVRTSWNSAPVASEHYDLQMEHRCFYLNQTADTMNTPQYFWRSMEEGESVSYTMVFAVDADLAGELEGAQNLALEFNGTGNDLYAPRYSALW